MSPRILALSGGVGGAKLALGLYQALPAHSLAVLVNTADDFEHLGLAISPDMDTLLYSLSGTADRERGWGRAQETWHFMDEVRRLGLPDWFQLGDRDVALHVARTQALRGGRSLTQFMAQAAERFGVAAELLPMSDDPVRTVLDTDRGALEFQHYFVAQRAAPVVRGLRYEGVRAARASPGALELLAGDALAAVILCPSNPWLSIDPILALPELRAALAACTAPVIAVAPIVAGAALKGPTAKIMAELGLAVSAATVAAHYGALLDGYVLDTADAALASALPLPTLATPTVMRCDDDKRQLARAVLDFAARLRA